MGAIIFLLKSIRDFAGYNPLFFVRHSSGTQQWNTAVEHSSATQLCITVVVQSCGLSLLVDDTFCHKNLSYLGLLSPPFYLISVIAIVVLVVQGFK